MPELSAVEGEAGPVSFEDVPLDWGLAQWDLLVEVIPSGSGSELRFSYQCTPDEPDSGAQWPDAFRRALEWAAAGNRPLSDLDPR